jgi:3-oxoadipate enol-lactonase
LLLRASLVSCDVHERRLQTRIADPYNRNALSLPPSFQINRRFPRSPEMTHASYWTASDGTKLFYRYDDFTDPWKTAPLVVLVHPGLGSSLRLFGWVAHLARKYRVVRPDIRGHGKSEPGPDAGLTHERLALDLVELFDHFGAERAHVMGSSAGGMIAGRAALRHPARFRSLAMYAATAGIPPSRPAKGNWLERVGRDGVRKFLAETAVDRIGEASPEHVQWYIESAEGVTPQFLARFVPVMASDDFTERLSELDMPVLLAVPDPDPMVERSEYARMREYVRNLSYVEFAGAGHSMTAEIPDACAKAYSEFLTQVESE